MSGLGVVSLSQAHTFLSSAIPRASAVKLREYSARYDVVWPRRGGKDLNSLFLSTVLALRIQRLALFASEQKHDGTLDSFVSYS